MDQERITHRTKEGFDIRSWVDEADRHMLSAKTLRNIKKRRRALFKKPDKKSKLRHVQSMDAATHSSMLLLAYAVELYLKAGLTRIYLGCSKELFEKEVKGKYGHKLTKISKAIEYPKLAGDAKKQLKFLEDIIIREGRYPFLSKNKKEDIKSRNNRAARFWNDDEFKELVKLAESIRDYASTIGGSSEAPLIPLSLQIDHDGYFSFRCGGHIQPRITVKYSSLQRQNKEDNEAMLKSLILQHSDNPLLHSLWDKATYRDVPI